MAKGVIVECECVCVCVENMVHGLYFCADLKMLNFLIPVILSRFFLSSFEASLDYGGTYTEQGTHKHLSEYVDLLCVGGGDAEE